jgi:hypothetical protein
MFSVGFPLASPERMIPWLTSPGDARRLLAPTPVREVTPTYLTLAVTSFLGAHQLGLHFRGPEGPISHFEVWRPESYATTNVEANLVANFVDLDARLAKAVGPPVEQTDKGSFRSSRWLGPRFEITHVLMDRFGLEDRLAIRPRGL